MGEKPAYPRYFVFGATYDAPTTYVMAIDEDAVFIMEPSGSCVRAPSVVEYWERRVIDGDMTESARETIAEEIERWNKAGQSPNLQMPEPPATTT
jgi:hypothetical protein